MARRVSPEIETAIQRTASRMGVDPATLRAFVLIESGGNPNVTTGSYRGLLQLSNDQFRRYGGEGNVYDVDANLSAGAAKLKDMSAGFERRFGRQPSAAELYMMHQQGEGGSAAHWKNPDAPAWQNMASTAEGRQKGEAWAKRAIWGNVPDDVKAKYGSVDNMTSRDFVQMWEQKVARFGGAPSGSSTPTAVASATSPTPEAGAAQPQQAPAKNDGAILPAVANAFGLSLPKSLGSTPATTPGAAPALSDLAGLTSGGAGLSVGPFSIGGGGEAARLASAMSGMGTDDPVTQAPSPPQLDLNGRPVDMGRLMAALRKRSSASTV